MDISFTRHKIITEEAVYTASGEIPVQCSINIRGEQPAKKVLKSIASAGITTKTVLGKNISVEGTISLQVICLDADFDLFCAEHTLPFSKTFETDRELADCEISAEVGEDRITSSITSPTQISVNGVVEITLCAKKQNEDEVVCDIDDREIQQLKDTAYITIPMGRGEKNLIVEEEVAIGNGQPSVACVIRNNATAMVEETKIIGNKVMVKGSVKVYVLYLPEEGSRPKCFEESFPFSQLVDVEGITDDCRCDAQVKVLFCDLSPQVGIDDEIRSFSLAAKLGLSVKAYCDSQLPTVLDAYSTKDAMKPIMKEFSFKKICENKRDRFIAKKDLEFSDGAIGSVIDMWCEIKKYMVKPEKTGFKTSGTAMVNILAFDSDGVPECYEKPVEFEYLHTFDTPLEMPEVGCAFRVPHTSYTIIKENTLSVALEFEICATVYDSKKYALVVDMSEDEEKENLNRKSSIVLYFADAGESIWNIARRYNSSVEEIKTLNGITEDVLSLPKKFIIPTK